MSAIKSLFERGESLRRQGDLQGAEEAFVRVIKERQDAHAAWHGLGLVAHAAGHLDKAIEFVGKAAALDKLQAVYRRNLGELNRLAGKTEEAVTMARETLLLSPNDADAHYNLALALSDCGKIEEAEAAYRKAVELAPKHNLAWNNLGALLEQTGKRDAALDAYKRAIAIDPLHAEAQNNAGAILSEDGEIDRARAHYEAAVAAKPDFAEAHQNLSALKTYTENDPQIEDLETLALRGDQLSHEQRTRLFFALGKAREDTGDYARAFVAFAEANRLQHMRIRYDRDAASHTIDTLIDRFDEHLLQKYGKVGSRSAGPIFIVGMPRSGTTLVEQILASHRDVHGAGELSTMHDCIRDRVGENPISDGGEWVSRADEAFWHKLGEDYIAKTRPLAPKGARITDKMPGNYHYLGAIGLSLPEAKIIHVKRQPMDVIWSNFSRHFTRTMEFAYDLGDLAHTWNNYNRLMRHWRNLLPKSVIYELKYENLVADLVGETQALLHFLGLGFDAACLEFHLNRRQVRTASIAQVRQPIYSSSIGRWTNYERQLAKMSTSLLTE